MIKCRLLEGQGTSRELRFVADRIGKTIHQLCGDRGMDSSQVPGPIAEVHLNSVDLRELTT